MISRSFFRSSIIYSIVGALPYASGFLLLPWFTAYLTPAQFGVNALYIALMYFIQIISAYGMETTVSVFYFDYRDDRRRLSEFLGTAFTGIAVLGGFTFLAFSLGGLKVFNLVFKSGDYLELIPFGLFTIISGVFNSIFKTYSSLLMYQQRPVRFFWVNISNFLLTIGSSLAILYLFPYTLYGPILGRLIPAVTVASVSLTMLGKEFGLSWNPAYIRKILHYSTPIMIYAILTWVVTYIDRFLIVSLMGDSTYVGIYDIAVKIVLGIELVLAGMINTINPKVYSIWKEKDIRESTVEINRYYSGLTALFMLIIPLFVILAPILIPLVIFKPVYYQAFAFLGILATGYVTRVWFYMFLAPLVFFKKTIALPRVFAISALINVAAGIFFIRHFGLIGAVWVNFLIKPVQAGLMYLECRRIYKFRLNAWKIFIVPGIYIAFVIISDFFTPPALKFQLGVVHFVVASMLVAITYRRELVPAMKGIYVRLGKKSNI